MVPVELGTGALRPRPWREDDVAAVVAAMQDPVMQLWNGPPVATRPAALDGVRHDEFVWGRLAEDPPPAWT